jgi:hypothetical protein
MKPVNRLLTILSLTAVVITVERISPTTRVLLQPYNFLHLHEALQMGVITAFSVVISFLILRVVSGTFRLMAEGSGVVLGVLFILGTYFYATGNGAHEIASFLFNEYCDTKHVGGGMCGSSYFDDYFLGNIVYFVGLGLSDLALILFERRNPDRTFSSGDARVTVANGVVLALTFIAYDAFDRVLVGLTATIVFAVIFDALLLTARAPFRSLPFTLYSALGFTLATVVALPLRIAGA